MFECLHCLRKTATIFMGRSMICLRITFCNFIKNIYKMDHPDLLYQLLENPTRLKRDNNVSALFSGPSQRRNQKKFTSMKPTLKTIVRLQMVL